VRVTVADVRPGDILLGPSWGDPARVVGREPSRVYLGEVHLRLQFQSGLRWSVRLPADAVVERAGSERGPE
jgi:hypothetical protein